MRGAIAKLDGVEVLDLEKGNTNFKVKYDPSKTELSKILAQLKADGEPASKLE